MEPRKKRGVVRPSRARRLIRRFLVIVLIVFFGMNVVAALHAWRFTHFRETGSGETGKAGHLSATEKVRVLLSGIDNPRPVNVILPHRPYTTLRIRSNKMLECWYIKTSDTARGTVILFHGYGGEKSSLLDKAEEFLVLGYNTLLVDFMGSGGSEGNQTTIGFKEAEEVRSCFEYINDREKNAGDRPEMRAGDRAEKRTSDRAGKHEGDQAGKAVGAKPIYLFGTSMGAVAILKALHDENLHPAGIIIECPFGTLYQTVCARFRNLGVPSFPMAGLLTTWGGIENGFSPFRFRPVDYAAGVDCPCLLLYGEKDEKVSRQEIDGIYQHLRGRKQLRTYPLAGHENYLVKYRSDWVRDIRQFLNQE